MNIVEIAKEFNIDIIDDTPMQKAQEIINDHLFYKTYIFNHIKSGKDYIVKSVVINCTNVNDGQLMICYENSENMIFVREAKEFFDKFKVERSC